MAKLLIQCNGETVRPVNLKLGVNRLGRDPQCEIHIDDSSISGIHCEFMLADGKLSLRDSNSTNGTYVNDRLIQQTTLESGQMVRVGRIQLLVEKADATVAIPTFETAEIKAASVQLADGAISCENHSSRRAIGKCTKCGKVFCLNCLHHLGRVGGKRWKLCPVCSAPCEPLAGALRRKKSLLIQLRDTLIRPFK